MKIEVSVHWVAAVDNALERLNVPKGLFDEMCAQLSVNPLLGDRVGDGDLREWSWSGYAVRYVASADFREIVLVQLRLYNEPPPRWTKPLGKFIGDIARFLAKEVVKRWLGF